MWKNLAEKAQKCRKLLVPSRWAHLVMDHAILCLHSCLVEQSMQISLREIEEKKRRHSRPNWHRLCVFHLCSGVEGVFVGLEVGEANSSTRPFIPLHIHVLKLQINRFLTMLSVPWTFDSDVISLARAPLKSKFYLILSVISGHRILSTHPAVMKRDFKYKDSFASMPR